MFIYTIGDVIGAALLGVVLWVVVLKSICAIVRLLLKKATIIFEKLKGANDGK